MQNDKGCEGVLNENWYVVECAEMQRQSEIEKYDVDGGEEKTTSFCLHFTNGFSPISLISKS